MPQRMIVYIDGFNLYHGLKNASGRTHLWLDVVALAQSLRPKQELIKVKYFTASVLDNPKGQARQDRYQAALRALHGSRLDIIQGRYQAKPVMCRECGAKRKTYEEKETDVNVAAHLVSDAANREMDTALIVSADSDYIPAIRAARKLNPDLFVAAAFPPERRSAHLKDMLPASFPIGMDKIRKSQLPEQFGVRGETYQRPAYWTRSSEEVA